MLAAPPLDREIDNRDVDYTDDAPHCSGASALRCTPHIAAQHDVAKKHKPQDQDCRQLGIPGPPYSPDRFGPQGTHNDADGQEDRTQFGGSTRDPIQPLIRLQQIDDAEDSLDDEGKHADPGSRDVKVEDAKYLSLHTINRRVKENQPDRDQQADSGQPPQQKSDDWYTPRLPFRPGWRLLQAGRMIDYGHNTFLPGLCGSHCLLHGHRTLLLQCQVVIL